MARPKSPFHMEAAGSLAPELEGREHSALHPERAHPQAPAAPAPREDEPHGA